MPMLTRYRSDIRYLVSVSGAGIGIWYLYPYQASGVGIRYLVSGVGVRYLVSGIGIKYLVSVSVSGICIGTVFAPSAKKISLDNLRELPGWAKIAYRRQTQNFLTTAARDQLYGTIGRHQKTNTIRNLSDNAVRETYYFLDHSEIVIHPIFKTDCSQFRSKSLGSCSQLPASPPKTGLD